MVRTISVPSATASATSVGLVPEFLIQELPWKARASGRRVAAALDTRIYYDEK